MSVTSLACLLIIWILISVCLSHNVCQLASEDSETTLVMGIEANIFIGVVLSVFVICLVCVVNLAVCLCRRESTLNPQHRVALTGASTGTLAHPASYNGTAGATLSPATTRYATLPLDKMGRPLVTNNGNGQNGGTEKPPPYPGNLIGPGVGSMVGGHHLAGGGHHLLPGVNHHLGGQGNGHPHQQQQQHHLTNNLTTVNHYQQQQQLTSGQPVTLLTSGDGSAAHLVTGRADGLTSNGTSVHPVQQVT